MPVVVIGERVKCATSPDLLRPAWRAATLNQERAIRRRVERLSATIEAFYGTPNLGNLDDPLEEAVYIILTYQTDLERARKVWTAFREQFQNWETVLSAPSIALEKVLQPSGFQQARARLIRSLLAAVQDRWSVLSLESLRSLTTAAAEAELRSLPGLDIKGARCVLLYSLGRAVFPVDSNAFRFMHRFGVLQPGARYRRRSTHDQLQGLVHPALRRNLHINLVAHGQQTCLPRKPRCRRCPVRRSCLAARTGDVAI